MNKKEVKIYLEQNNLSFDRYLKWMEGQIVGIDSEGRPIYYDWDVKRFVELNSK